MTTIGLDLSDFGFAPDDDFDEPDAPAAGAAVVPEGRSLVDGSALAKALYSVWSGAAVTIVDSPPGAGKTTLVTQLTAYLKERSDLKIVIACPTRRGAYDIAERIGAELGPDKDGNPQIAMSISKMDPPPGVSAGGAADGGRNIPVVRTVASCKASTPPACDLMIVDEAYQVTFADISAAADNADQLLMVGDPGQIGPVVTADVSAFRGYEVAPQMRAPEVFAKQDYTESHALDTTYRLGQETVDAISCLYKFPFSSARPDRFLTDEEGNRVSEIVPLLVEPAATFDDLPTLVQVAEYAADLIGVELVETDADGQAFTRPLEASDIAIVVAHNAQSSGITAVLRSLDAEGIFVGTADKMQGGQWHAVVAMDPFIGYTNAGSHQLSPGRLCVMASRHMTHLTWVHDGNWETALLDPDIDQDEARLGRKVRYALTAE
ncbi:AAA family ATPase [Arthrobacter caoxuetaonis]|uniref:AAA family ATPase n=1 Tax=Arthrobacter caoxuetaonis TaxID=2886935 RepID=A0A9X1MHA2_9MICC|nr:AAA family ATPase [Arthrobacter caoxuetaonis]MCC3299811.1 AAA family ATPase [Arthrobacter caoxuetaonis]USQ59289.1 AAA family ATPase [Arthrobacter caoxuetaonis]